MLCCYEDTIHSIKQLFKLIPMWIAPNVLTFAGFLSLMLSFVVLSYYDYNFYGPCSDKSNCSKPNALLAEHYQQFVDNTGFDYSKIHLYMCDCVPAYVWLLGAICQFVSHTLDGMDGKQARRTKSSSPLGTDALD
jgi:ethanolaminephosphotransferase